MENNTKRGGWGKNRVALAREGRHLGKSSRMTGKDLEMKPEGRRREDVVKIGAIRDLGNDSSSSDSQGMKIFYSGLLKISS